MDLSLRSSGLCNCGCHQPCAGAVLLLVSLQLSTESIGTSLDLLLEKTLSPGQTLCTSHDSSGLMSTHFSFL